MVAGDQRTGEEPCYTSAYAVAAEGHRIGLVTCLMCGATLTLDPVMNVLDPVTGGEKGSKLARFDLLPYDALWAVAERFGEGANRYAARNWEKGYAWGLSHAAQHRHDAAFMAGEDIDPDSGQPHLTAVAWHALVRLAFYLRAAGTDDRGVRRAA